MKTITILVISVMALLAQGKVVEGDDSPGLCDMRFGRVDTRTPSHLLPPGVAADALNTRFEDGRGWPRYACELQAWGATGVSFIPAGSFYSNIAPIGTYEAHVTPENEYFYIVGNSINATCVVNLPGGGQQAAVLHAGWNVLPGEVANGIIQLTGPLGGQITAQIIGSSGNVCGYVRFQDPQGVDCTVEVTDDWRDQEGEDGGRGRAWRIVGGNAPYEIPMNGQDIYGVARLIPCYNGLVMLRQDNERHYFPAANIIGVDEIQLNGPQGWNEGDQVQIVLDATIPSSFTGGNAPVNGTYCFVHLLGNNQVKLFADAAKTQAYTFNGGIGRFYLERSATQPGFGGNGAPPLIAQPGAEGQTMWDEGFGPVPANVSITAIANEYQFTAANHRLIPGDKVVYNQVAGPGNMPAATTVTGYVYPTNANQFNMYVDQENALANSGVNTVDAVFVAGSYAVKATASNQPMPPGREGFYTQQGCLVVVNGQNNLFISDPLDPLHFMPLSDEITANMGEADSIQAVCEIPNSDALIIYKEFSILGLYNFSEGLANAGESWTLEPITREYGLVAPLSVKQQGNSNMFLSRRGVDRIVLTAFGALLPVVRPPSYNQSKYIGLIDWNNASLATAETWSNRYLIAFPQAGQAAGAPANLSNMTVGGPQNNAVMSLNFLETDDAREEWGWEGLWTGITPVMFARLTLPGQGERLTYVDYNGNVNWLTDGWQDFGGTQINTMLLTRTYTGGTMRRKIFQSARGIWDTYNTALSVTAICPGVNRSYLLTPAAGLQYNPLTYLQGANVTAAYNPNTQQPPFNTPFRADYTPQVLAETVGNAIEQHQNIVEPLRCRIDAWGVQLKIQNAQGSVRVASVAMSGVLGPSADRRQA